LCDAGLGMMFLLVILIALKNINRVRCLVY